MNEELVLRLLTLKEPSSEIPKLLDSVRSEENFVHYWNDSCKRLLQQVTLAHGALLHELLKYSMEQILPNTIQSKFWIHTCSKVVMTGLQLFHDCRPQYTHWLEALENLFLFHSEIVAVEEPDPYGPSLFSLMGAFCMISYLDRFTPLLPRNQELDQLFGPAENKLVQFVASKHPSAVLFPFAFIAAHVMDVSVGPAEKPRQITEVFQVSIFMIFLIVLVSSFIFCNTNFFLGAYP
jgi:hypothetical protein